MKPKKAEIVIKTQKLNYDFYRLDNVRGKNRIPLFGIWKRKDRNGTYYENDINGRIFATLKEAKCYARSLVASD